MYMNHMNNMNQMNQQGFNNPRMPNQFMNNMPQQNQQPQPNRMPGGQNQMMNSQIMRPSGPNINMSKSKLLEHLSD